MEQEESSIQASVPKEESNNGNNSTASATNEPPSTTLPYVTTSEVLRQLNQNLEALAPPGEEEYCKPRFELQKRLPDGSTIPASQQDLQASDLQNKISQSAKFVAQLTPSDRKIWAEDQRQCGNALFQQGQYKAAMDIYLTCLVVKGSTTESEGRKDGAGSPVDLEFLSQTLLPVLNNLAQCTLQLGMQKKTKEFCGIALEEIAKHDEDAASSLDPIVLCKIHFKRAKAHRLTGHYSEARQDLNTSLSYVEKEEKEHTEDEGNDDEFVPTTDNPFRQAIQKEFRHLEAAEKEARKNRQRQKRSMQRALASTKSPSTSNTSSGKKQSATTTGTKADRATGGISVPNTEPRKYSSLRARKKVSDGNASPSAGNTTEEGQKDARDLSYWQYYWLVVARVAEMLLVLIGDEEELQERYESQEQARREDRKKR